MYKPVTPVIVTNPGNLVVLTVKTCPPTPKKNSELGTTTRKNLWQRGPRTEFSGTEVAPFLV